MSQGEGGGPKSEHGKKRSAANSYRHGARSMGIRVCNPKCHAYADCDFSEEGFPCSVEQSEFTRFVNKLKDHWGVLDPGAEALCEVAGFQWLRLLRANQVLASLVHGAWMQDREYLVREVRFLEGALSQTLRHARAMNGSRGPALTASDFALDADGD